MASRSRSNRWEPIAEDKDDEGVQSKKESKKEKKKKQEEKPVKITTTKAKPLSEDGDNDAAGPTKVLHEDAEEEEDEKVKEEKSKKTKKEKQHDKDASSTGDEESKTTEIKDKLMKSPLWDPNLASDLVPMKVYHGSKFKQLVVDRTCTNIYAQVRLLYPSLPAAFTLVYSIYSQDAKKKLPFTLTDKTDDLSVVIEYHLLRKTPLLSKIALNIMEHNGVDASLGPKPKPSTGDTKSVLTADWPGGDQDNNGEEEDKEEKDGWTKQSYKKEHLSWKKDDLLSKYQWGEYCLFWHLKRCKNEECDFKHEISPFWKCQNCRQSTHVNSQCPILCRKYKTNECRYGTTCIFKHSSSTFGKK